MWHFKYEINTTTATSSNRAPVVATTVNPIKQFLGNLVEHVDSHDDNTHYGTKESSFVQDKKVTFSLEPVTNDSDGTE